MKRAVVIAGPTASGKTAHAIALARRIGGEVVNADALQLYADLAILSARPSPDEQQGVPHHLFGVLDGAQAASAAAWRSDALEVLAGIWTRGAVPVIAGGTGLYIRALLEGIADVPPIALEVRDAVRAMGTEARAEALAREDPQMAARLHPNDSQRLARALEVVRSTGRSLADFHGPQPDGLTQVCQIEKHLLLPNRAQLYAACDARFERMMAAGALEEARTLMVRQLDLALPVMKAVGVPELLAHLRGEMSLAEAVGAAQQATRNYAKRQFTWMRNQFGDWPRADQTGNKQ
jgi:tRNA dimethylallyltransferase